MSATASAAPVVVLAALASLSTGAAAPTAGGFGLAALEPTSSAIGTNIAIDSRDHTVSSHGWVEPAEAHATVAAPSLARMLGNAMEVASHLDARIWGKAQTVLSKVVEEAFLLGISGPQLVAADDGDGALVVEWILDMRRIGFVFDVEDAQSGWYFVTGAGVQRSGRLDTLQIRDLLKLATEE